MTVHTTGMNREAQTLKINLFGSDGNVYAPFNHILSDRFAIRRLPMPSLMAQMAENDGSDGAAPSWSGNIEQTLTPDGEKISNNEDRTFVIQGKQPMEDFRRQQ